MTVLDYLPPIQISRRWSDMLIDGGYTNNLPVDVMHALYQPSFVVAADVENKAAEERIAHTSYFGTHLSGWWLLRTRIKEWIRAGIVGGVVNRMRALLGLPPDSTPQLKSDTTTAGDALLQRSIQVADSLWLLFLPIFLPSPVFPSSPT